MDHTFDVDIAIVWLGMGVSFLSSWLTNFGGIGGWGDVLHRQLGFGGYRRDTRAVKANKTVLSHEGLGFLFSAFTGQPKQSEGENNYHNHGYDFIKFHL